MKTTPLFLTVLLFIGLGAATRSVADVATGTPPPTSAQQAFSVAKDGVDTSMRDQVVSVYGTGPASGIQTWYIIFYDPSVASHGHVVRVENGQITRSYEAKGGVTYDNTLTFRSGQITDERAALAAAQDYAAQHALAYDHLRVLLRETSANSPFRWRVQLMNGPKSKGFVFVNAADGSFAMYSPPGSETGTASGTGGVVGDVKAGANDVKDTFLHIGGDLQEFFTGDRTVDQ
jgi:hypothetical protein